jgi:predicted small metal-binding protein
VDQVARVVLYDARGELGIRLDGRHAKSLARASLAFDEIRMESRRIAALAQSRRSSGKETTMAKVINCECGYVVRGATDEDLVAGAREHIQRDHPDMVGKMSDDDLLAMAEEA